MKNKLLKDTGGFSLVELIVVVLIMAIISGGAIIAFNSIFSNQASAAGKSVVSALKQTRAYALGKENKSYSEGRTDVYAEFRYSGSSLILDVCRKESATDVSILHSQTISSEEFKVKFYKVSGSTETEVLSMGDSDKVKIYFKKSTGGVSVCEKNNAEGGLVTGVNKIRIYRASNTGNYQDLVLVDLTGRCYLDTTT